MLRRNNSIAMIGSWLDACALWRLYMPYCNMPGAGFFIFTNKYHFELLAEKDIAIVQRCATPQQFEMIHTLRQMHIKVVYDLDDNMWELSPHNPAYPVINQLKNGFTKCIRQVDVLSVSTRDLAKAVRRHVKDLTNEITGREIPIVVVENRIDRHMFSKARRSDRLTVGWGGSTSHVADLKIIIPAVSNLARKYPNVDFEFRGLPFLPDELKNLPNVRQHIWLPVAEYAARFPQWGWDICLAPLTDEEFNMSKSAVKAIEAGHIAAPCLMSWVAPYSNFCRYDKDLRWLLCAGARNWEEKLEDLICDKDLREGLGKAMERNVDENYSLAKEHEGWKLLLDTAYSL